MGDVHGFFEARNKELNTELDRVLEQWEVLAEKKPFLRPEVYESLMQGIGDRSQEILNSVMELKEQTLTIPERSENFRIKNTL